MNVLIAILFISYAVREITYLSIIDDIYVGTTPTRPWFRYIVYTMANVFLLFALFGLATAVYTLFLALGIPPN